MLARRAIQFSVSRKRDEPGVVCVSPSCSPCPSLPVAFLLSRYVVLAGMISLPRSPTCTLSARPGPHAYATCVIVWDHAAVIRMSDSIGMRVSIKRSSVHRDGFRGGKSAFKQC
jgi:hypothetical protein